MRSWHREEDLVLIRGLHFGMTHEEIINLLPVPVGRETRTRGSIAYRILHLYETNQIQISTPQIRPREDIDIPREEINHILDSCSQILRGVMFLLGSNNGGDIDDL